MPTDLERAVIDTIVRLNRPTTDGVPYPASLLPIAQAVIEVVRSAERTEDRARLAAVEALLPEHENPRSSVVASGYGTGRWDALHEVRAALGLTAASDKVL